MQFLSFATIDEFVELIETRFHIARVAIDDEFMQHIMHVYETNNDAISRVEFDVLHAFIETNLRQCVARNYLRTLMKHHENEFANLFCFANETTFHNFAIVEINDDERIREIARIYVNDDASIRVES
jgi:hypothetical protein